MAGTPGRGGHDGRWGATGMGAEAVWRKLSYDIRKCQYWGIRRGGGRRRGRVRGGGNKKKGKREDKKKTRKYRIATGGHTGHGQG